MKINFAKFRRSQPYASELYGVYQPLLGWRSAIQKKAVDAAVARTNINHFQATISRYEPQVSRHKEVSRALARLRSASPLLAGNTVVGRKILESVTRAGIDDPGNWRTFTSADFLDKLLRDNRSEIAKHATSAAESVPDSPALREATIELAFARESQLAGVLADLNKSIPPTMLMKYLSPTQTRDLLAPPAYLAITAAAIEVSRAVISPIGLVHLFRQYYFEFDTFLGPSVQHLWLSPGSTVELVESSTRKVMVERYMENLLESTHKTETSDTGEDELSDSVRSENQNDTKAGVSISSTGAYDLGIIKGSVTPSASYDIASTAKKAREQTHRSMRQQTAKISSEIRKSYKTTFKVVTETTDTQSRRYVIANDTKKLVNYELRRKMRQVGVQVQDYGAHLCWQAYVDDPGKELGLSQLVHIATPEDLQAVPEPEGPVMPEPEFRAQPISLTLNWRSEDKGRSGFIPMHPKLILSDRKAGYIFDRAEVTIVSGPSFWNIRTFPRTADEGPIRFEGQTTPSPAEADEIETDVPGQPERSVRSVVVGLDATQRSLMDDTSYDFTVQVTVIYRPSRKLLADTKAAHEKKISNFEADKARAMKESFFKSARDRIAEASNIIKRKFEDLREEERIVVYRSLIRQLLAAAGIKHEDPKVRHVFAELVQSMFDVDRMLYFVAPEWWMPKLTAAGGRGAQEVGLTEPDATEFATQHTVSWGGIPNRLDNYFITKDSTPAALGSSLGWILQLDGDTLRNAFINAPWVKAVVPIRAGREWDALDWLRSDVIEGSDGLDAPYRSDEPGDKVKMLTALKVYAWPDPFWTNHYAGMSNPEDITVVDALRYLIICIQAIAAKAKETMPDSDVSDHNYLRTDQVFEHGFDPLAGGFRAEGNGDFEVFDQWIEILPTDQIVPVEVEYDPVTGRLKE